MQRECKSTADLNIEYNAGNGKKIKIHRDSEKN
jgi:hypothetical protein